jgi:hypothetical protein
MAILDTASPCPGVPEGSPIVALIIAREALKMLCDGPMGKSPLDKALSNALEGAHGGCSMATLEAALGNVQGLIAGWWEDYGEEDYSQPLVRPQGCQAGA